MQNQDKELRIHTFDRLLSFSDISDYDSCDESDDDIEIKQCSLLQELDHLQKDKFSSKDNNLSHKITIPKSRGQNADMESNYSPLKTPVKVTESAGSDTEKTLPPCLALRQKESDPFSASLKDDKKIPSLKSRVQLGHALNLGRKSGNLSSEKSMKAHKKAKLI